MKVIKYEMLLLPNVLTKRPNLDRSSIIFLRPRSSHSSTHSSLMHCGAFDCCSNVNELGDLLSVVLTELMKSDVLPVN